MINKLEQFVTDKFKFDAKYTFRGGFWILLGHLFTILALLATSYVFANFLDPQLYGNYRYLISATAIIALFSLTGLNPAVTQATAKGFCGFFHEAVITSLRYGLLTGAVSLLTSGYYFLNGNQLLGLGFILIAVFQPLINTSGLIFPYFHGQQKFNVSTHWHALRTIITTISIVLATLLSENIIYILIAFLASNLLANLIPFFFNKPAHLEDYEVETKPIIKYAKHTSAQNIFVGIANQLDKILIFQNLGAKDLAIYAFATALPDQYKGITKTIDVLLLPRFSQHKSEAIRSKVFYKSVIYFLFLSVCAILYFIAAPHIFDLLYPAYSEYVFLSQIYVIGIIFGFGNIPRTAFKAQMDNRLLYKYKVVIASFQIGSLVILLTMYGLIGAVIARVLYRAFVCFYAYYLYYNKSTMIREADKL